MEPLRASTVEYKDTCTLLSMLVQEHVGAAALNHVAGRIVHGAAVEGGPGQRRTRQVRHAGNFALCQAKLD